jgi:hypothetical protein
MATRDVTYVDSGDEDVLADPRTLALPLPPPAPAPASPAPAPSPEPSVEVASFVASLALRPTQQQLQRQSVSDHNWQILSSAPFRILDRGPRLTSILFVDGRSRILDTTAVDAFVQMTTHAPTPLPGPPPPRLPRSLLPPVPTPTVTPPRSRPLSPFFSPAPSPAFTWQPARPPTPFHEPESPPTPLTTCSPHRDITYQHGSSNAAHQSSSVPAPAPLAQWRQAQAEEDARPIVPMPWKQFTWGTTEDNNQEPEPWGRAPRASSDSSSDSSPHSYAHTRSAHRPPASHAVIAMASARDPSDPDPVAILPILVGLDSYSDITVAAPELVYNKRKIQESVCTGAGASDYFEEGFIDIADGLYSFRTLPALVASSPHHLPSSCSLLLGVPQLNELDIRVDVHRKHRNLPLSSYDPAIIFAAESPLERRLSEKDLDTWARHNASKPVGSIPYSYLDVDVNPALSM